MLYCSTLCVLIPALAGFQRDSLVGKYECVTLNETRKPPRARSFGSLLRRFWSNLGIQIVRYIPCRAQITRGVSWNSIFRVLVLADVALGRRLKWAELRDFNFQTPQNTALEKYCKRSSVGLVPAGHSSTDVKYRNYSPAAGKNQVISLFFFSNSVWH